MDWKSSLEAMRSSFYERREASATYDEVLDPLVLLVRGVEEERELVEYLLAVAALQHDVIATRQRGTQHALFLLLLGPVAVVPTLAALRDGVEDLRMKQALSTHRQQTLTGKRVDGRERLLLVGDRVVVQTVAEPLVQVGALRVAVVLRVRPRGSRDVGVEVDHDGGLLAEVEQTLQRRLLGEKLVCGGGLASCEREEEKRHVGKTDVDGGEEDLELDLQEGLEVLEEVEDHAQRQREIHHIVRLRVLDDVLAEAALKELDERQEVHDHVAVHLQKRVDSGQPVAQTGQVGTRHHGDGTRALLGVGETDEEREDLTQQRDVVRLQLLGFFVRILRVVVTALRLFLRLRCSRRFVRRFGRLFGRGVFETSRCVERTGGGDVLWREFALERFRLRGELERECVRGEDARRR